MANPDNAINCNNKAITVTITIIVIAKVQCQVIADSNGDGNGNGFEDVEMEVQAMLAMLALQVRCGRKTKAVRYRDPRYKSCITMGKGEATCIEIESNTRLQLDDDFLIAQKPRWLKCLNSVHLGAFSRKVLSMQMTSSSRVNISNSKEEGNKKKKKKTRQSCCNIYNQTRVWAGSAARLFGPKASGKSGQRFWPHCLKSGSRFASFRYFYMYFLYLDSGWYRTIFFFFCLFSSAF